MDEEALRGFFEARWREVAEDPSPWRGAYRGFNLITLQIESLQTFPLHRTLEGREITPELNRLAERGFEWTACFGQNRRGQHLRRGAAGPLLPPAPTPRGRRSSAARTGTCPPCPGP